MGRLLTLFLALFAPAFGQSGPRLGSFSGVVVDAETETGVPRASLRLNGRESGKHYASVTADNGEFRLDRLAPDTYQLRVEGRGYLAFNSANPRTGHGPSAVRVVAGLEAGGYRIELLRFGVIAGVVEDELGRPFPKVAVTASRLIRRGEKVEARYGGASQTDDEGRFRIADLLPGQYIVSAKRERNEVGDIEQRPPPDDPEGETLDLGYLTTYYPNALQASQALPLDLGYGQQLSGIRIRLERNRILRLEVSLSGRSDGWPQVELRTTDPLGGIRSHAPARVTPDGQVTFEGLTPGQYMLTAEREREGLWRGAREVVELTDRSLQLELSLRPGAVVRGRVLLNDPDWRIEEVAALVSFEPADEPDFGRDITVEAGRDGGFSTARLLPGSYRLEAQGHMRERGRVGSFYLEEARHRGLPISGSVVVEQSPERNVFTLTLARAATVGGRVLDDRLQPGSAAFVLLFAGDGRGTVEMPLVEVADPTGEFFFQRLIPGERRLIAVPEFDRDAVPDQTLRELAQRAQPVEVEKAGQHWIELELDRPRRR